MGIITKYHTIAVNNFPVGYSYSRATLENLSNNVNTPKVDVQRGREGTGRVHRTHLVNTQWFSPQAGPLWRAGRRPVGRGSLRSAWLGRGGGGQSGAVRLLVLSVMEPQGVILVGCAAGRMWLLVASAAHAVVYL